MHRLGQGAGRGARSGSAPGSSRPRSCARRSGSSRPAGGDPRSRGPLGGEQFDGRAGRLLGRGEPGRVHREALGGLGPVARGYARPEGAAHVELGEVAVGGVLPASGHGEGARRARAARADLLGGRHGSQVRARLDPREGVGEEPRGPRDAAPLHDRCWTA